MRGGAHLAFAALRSSSGPCDTCRYYRGTGGLCRKNSSEIEMVTVASCGWRPNCAARRLERVRSVDIYRKAHGVDDPATPRAHTRGRGVATQTVGGEHGARYIYAISIAAGNRAGKRACTNCQRDRIARLGVATNDSTSGAEKTLVTLGVAQLFDAAYGYDAVANPKPAPDTLLHSWILAWDVHALTTDPLHLYEGNVYFPFPLSLTYSDSMLSGALMVAPLLLVTGNAVLAHNVLTLAALLIAALGMYLLGRSLTGDDTAGVVAVPSVAVVPKLLSSS